MTEDKSFSSTVAVTMGRAVQRAGQKDQDAGLQGVGERLEMAGLDAQAAAKPSRPRLTSDQIERAIEILAMVREASPHKAKRIDQLILVWQGHLDRAREDGL